MKRTNVIIVLMVLVFLSLSWYFSWFIMDDAYFTYRYSENLIDSFGLNWNTDGKPVEAYTTFGWAIINTIPIKFNIPPEIFSQIISIISALGIATTLLFLFERKQKIYIFPALGILLLNPAFVVITIQGMETTFTALFVLISAVSLYKSRLKLSLISSTVSMLLRPDTLIFFLFMYGFYIRKNKIKELLYNGFFLTILPLSIWFIWRVSYYGYILPNAFYVKSATSIMYYFQSMVTLSSFIAFLLPIIIFTLPFLFYVDKSIMKRTMPLVLGTVFFLILHLFIRPVQGYFWRFQTPVLGVILAILIIIISESSFSFNVNMNWKKYLLLTLIFIITISPLNLIDDAIHQTDTKSQHDRAEMGKVLGNYKGYSMFISESGAVPYYSKWKSADSWGLTNEDIAHNGLDYDFLEEFNPDMIMYLHRTKYRPQKYYGTPDDFPFEYLQKKGFVLVAVTIKDPYKEHHYFVNKKLANNNQLICDMQNIKSINYNLERHYEIERKFGIKEVICNKGESSNDTIESNSNIFEIPFH